MQRSCVLASLGRAARHVGARVGTRDLSAVSARHIAPCVGQLWSRRALSTNLQRFASAATAVKSAPVNPEPTPSPTSQNEVPFLGMDDSRVSVGWDTRTWSKYHHLWLRDHCRCERCFHPVTKQRLLNTFEIPPDVKPANVEAQIDGLAVTWAGDEPHGSLYPWSWLKRNSYDPPIKHSDWSSEKILWGAKIEKSPPTVTYDEVMSDQGPGLYNWLSKIDRFGFCFVTGVPATPEATEEVSRRIGFIRETQYGRFWDFTADMAKGDTAYTTLALGAHTDNTYFTDPCGIQLFHLLSHTGGTGGATLLVDGFYVGSLLKELHPEAYSLLSRIRVPAHAAGEPSALYRPSPPAGYPTLGHGANGELVQVRWNNDDRSVMNGLGPNEVEEWYEAIKLWNKLLTSPDSEYWVQLTGGTVVAIDNHRVLHGRSAFSGERRMCGAYIGVDEYRSQFAVLQERFAPSDIERDTAAYATVNGRSLWNPAL